MKKWFLELKGMNPEDRADSIIGTVIISGAITSIVMALFIGATMPY